MVSLLATHCIGAICADLHVRHYVNSVYVYLPINPQQVAMKSKLTLRIRDSVKAEAKAIAAQRGTSVSQMVETYFQMLAGPKSEEVSDEASLTNGDAPDAASKRAVDLSPRIQALQSALGQPAPDVDLDADTEQWVAHAVKKHA